MADRVISLRTVCPHVKVTVEESLELPVVDFRQRLNEGVAGTVTWAWQDGKVLRPVGPPRMREAGTRRCQLSTCTTAGKTAKMCIFAAAFAIGINGRTREGVAVYSLVVLAFRLRLPLACRSTTALDKSRAGPCI